MIAATTKPSAISHRPSIDQPGALLAEEVDDACRGWNRGQALAVIDACQRDDLDTLPVTWFGG